jgi:hypothetical protein
MGRDISIKEKKLYRTLRDEGVSTKKAHRVVAVIGRPKKAKPGRRIAKPITALTGKVKKLRPAGRS